MHLRWDASPWLLVPVPFLAAPAAALWFGAALQVVQLRLPRPPWSATDVIGALLLIFTALLTLAIAAHGVSG